MLLYYLDLARRSFRRDRALTALMIVAIAFGVGASMTMLTVLHVVSRDPIPGKSHKLYAVQLDPGRAVDYQAGKEPDDQLTRFDAEALLRAHKGDRQALMTGGSVAVDPQKPGLTPFFVNTRSTSTDFFTMFEAPFVAGAPWTVSDDDNASRVAVIAKSLADKLFGTVDCIGKSVRGDNTDLRIVGVLDDWQVTPRFWDIHTGTYGELEALFVPFSTSRALKLRHDGSVNCWGDTNQDQYSVQAPCTWVQYWVELDSPDKAAAYREYLVHYSEEQKAAGRFERPPNVRLRDVREWLDFREVVPRDVKLQMWVALGFLLVCLVNCVGLLLTKFLRGSAQLGVRRALGASKRSIFTQLLVESGVIGLVGGVIGLGVAWLGLWAVRQQPTPYAHLAELDLSMLATTFGLAVIATLLAGLLPAWRGCQVSVASQLKAH